MNHDTTHPHGLKNDLDRIVQLERRRGALRLLAGFGAAATWPLVGCGGSQADSSAETAEAAASEDGTVSALARRRGGRGSATAPSASASSSSGTTTGDTSGTCSTIPSETAGPYPGDGTNSNSSGVVNALTQSGIVRADMRSSFGSFSGTAAGVPLTVVLNLVNTGSSCAALSGYAVYLWHCDADGKYSLYDLPAANYLRAVQASDSSGQVVFTTIFPGCYSGRWPHMHFEVFSSLAAATSGNNDIKTSQLALPQSTCSEVYASSSVYSTSVTNLARNSLSTDNVFSDGTSLQMATISGSLSSGLTATLTVGVAA